MHLDSDSFADNGPIPAEFAFGKPAPQAHMALSDNRSPHLRWSGAPAGTRSFAILCTDVEVPTGLRHQLDDLFAELVGQRLELRTVELTQIGRGVDAVESFHLRSFSLRGNGPKKSTV